MDTASLSTQELTAYLKHVMETESSLFRQKMAKEEAQKSLYYEEPLKKEIACPQLSQPPRPKEASQPLSVYQFVALLALAVLGVTGLHISFDQMKYGGFDVFFGLCGVLFSGMATILGGIGVPAFFASISEAKKDKIRYEYEVREYGQKCAKARADYQQARTAYWQQVEAEDERHKLAVTAAKDRYQATIEQIALLDKPLAETESVLQSLYDTEILFPKYRNFPAVCMFYEYFASGRCSELAGPNGAYNLYESELRQNLIINQLDAIMGSLEGIKQNQFILYTEAKKTADALPGISRDITNMLDSSQQITQSAAIAAQCAEATQTNTEALKYLAFIKR